MPVPRPRQPERLLAIGGVVGPAAFVTGWALNGARLDGYSPVDDAISNLAEVGATTRPSMTAALVVFGLGVPAYSVALRATLPGPAWLAAAACGASSLAVAALPLGAGVDAAHGVAAFAAYVSLAAMPLLAVRPLRRRGRRVAAGLSVITGVATGAALAMTLTGGAHGFWQRAGLTIGDAWLVTTAVLIAVRGRAAFV